MVPSPSGALRPQVERSRAPRFDRPPRGVVGWSRSTEHSQVPRDSNRTQGPPAWRVHVVCCLGLPVLFVLAIGLLAPLAQSVPLGAPALALLVLYAGFRLVRRRRRAHAPHDPAES